jgi:hypothetical protein
LAASPFGSSIFNSKQPSSLRIFFQNIKGLSHTFNNEDFKYLATSLKDLDVDISGFAETNTAWQHSFLRHKFSSSFRQHTPTHTAKINFASPTREIDDIPSTETYQAGGSISIAIGPWATTICGAEIYDPTGLGRWSGFHVRGKHNNVLSVITAYRTCSGSRVTAPLGSTFHREVEFFRTTDTTALCNPRKRFFTDISKIIHDLHDANHAIILMLDANSVLTQDTFFPDSMEKLHLHDLHQSDPAPSTYIGSSNRRIDYIFGCQKVLTSLDQAGTLSYLDGPQSDHRGIFVDLNTLTLLHHHADDNRIQPPQVRRLKTGNPELVATYIKSMTESLYQSQDGSTHRRSPE